MKKWAFGTVKRTRLLILSSLNNCLTKNTSSSPRNLKMSLTPLMKDLQRDQTMKKESNCQTGEHRTIFIGLRLMMTPTKKISQVLVQTHKDESYNSVFDPPYSKFLTLNSFSLQLLFPIILAMMMIFVPGRILVLQDNPHYFVERHISCYMNAILSCRYLLGIERNKYIFCLSKSRKENYTQR